MSSENTYYITQDNLPLSRFSGTFLFLVSEDFAIPTGTDRMQCQLNFHDLLSVCAVNVLKRKQLFKRHKVNFTTLRYFALAP